MIWIPETLSNWPDGSLALAAAFGVLMGLTQCFFGYRLFKVFLGLSGFIVGAILLGNIGWVISENEGLALIAAVMGGVIGAGVSLFLYLVGIFIVGALMGGILGSTFLNHAADQVAGMADVTEIVILLLMVVLGGILALFFQKLIIVASTASTGAWSAINGLAYFVTGSVGLEVERQSEAAILITVCWLALAAVGLATQYKLVQSDDRRDRLVQR